MYLNFHFVVNSEYANLASDKLRRYKYFPNQNHNCNSMVIIRQDIPSPPQFQILIQDEAVAFDLVTGKRLETETAFTDIDDFIRRYWNFDRCEIAKVWNSNQREIFEVPPSWHSESSIEEIDQKVRDITKLMGFPLPNCREQR